MNPTWQIIVTIVSSVLASSGVWTYIMRKSDCKNAQTEMLIGLGHDRIIYLGKKYIERGTITTDEYENLNDYLYKPYKALGGNGSAERIMKEVETLRLNTHNQGGTSK